MHIPMKVSIPKWGLDGLLVRLGQPNCQFVEHRIGGEALSHWRRRLDQMLADAERPPAMIDRRVRGTESAIGSHLLELLGQPCLEHWRLWSRHAWATESSVVVGLECGDETLQNIPWELMGPALDEVGRTGDEGTGSSEAHGTAIVRLEPGWTTRTPRPSRKPTIVYWCPTADDPICKSRLETMRAHWATLGLGVMAIDDVRPERLPPTISVHVICHGTPGHLQDDAGLVPYDDLFEPYLDVLAQAWFMVLEICDAGARTPLNVSLSEWLTTGAVPIVLAPAGRLSVEASAAYCHMLYAHLERAGDLTGAMRAGLRAVGDRRLPGYPGRWHRWRAHCRSISLDHWSESAGEARPVFEDSHVPGGPRAQELLALREERARLRGAGESTRPVDTRIDSLKTEMRRGGRLRPGDIIGGARLYSHGGEGGHGQVWRARRLSPGQAWVAVKVLHPHHAADPERRQHFHAALDRQRALSLPGIIPVLGQGEDGGYFYGLFEWIDAPDLGRHLESPWIDPPPEPAVLIERVAEVVAGAHAAAVVHGDLKPANFLVSVHRVWLTDFELAHGIRRRHDCTESLRVGSALWAAPEVMAGEPVTPTSDVYALGRIALAILEGRARPRHRLADRAGAPPLAELVESISDPHAAVIDRALAPMPDARQADAGKFLDEWRAASQAPQTHSRVSDMARQVRRRKGIRALALVALLATAVGGWMIYLWAAKMWERAELLAACELAASEGRAAEALAFCRAAAALGAPLDPEKIWRLDSAGARAVVMRAQDLRHPYAIRDDGSEVFVAVGHDVERWELGPIPVRSIVVHGKEDVTGVEVSDTHLAVSRQASVALYDLDGLDAGPRWNVEVSPNAALVGFTPSGGHLIATSDGVLGAMAVEGGRWRRLNKSGLRRSGYAIHPDEDMVAIAHVGGPLVVVGAEDYGPATCTLQPDSRLPRTLVEWSPAGDKLAVTSDTEKVTIYTFPGCERLWATPPREGSVLRVRWTPDGRSLLTSGEDGRVTKWDAGSGGRPFEVARLGARVKALSIDGDGQRIVIGADDLSYLLAEGGGKHTVPLDNAGLCVERAAFVGEEQLFGLNVFVGALLTTLPQSAPVLLAAFDRSGSDGQGEIDRLVFVDNQRLVFSEDRGQIGFLDGRAGRPSEANVEVIGDMMGVDQRSEPVSIGARGRPWLMGRREHELCRAPVERGAQPDCLAPVMTPDFVGYRMFMVCSEPGWGVIASHGAARRYCAWNTESELRWCQNNVGLRALCYIDPDANRLVVSSSRAIQLRSLDDGALVAKHDIGGTPVIRGHLLTDRRYLALGQQDGRLSVLDLDSGRTIGESLAHAQTAWALAESPDGRTLVAGAFDGTIGIYQLPGLELLHLIRASDVDINTVAIHPDGHTFAAAGLDGMVRFYDLTSGRLLYVLEAHRSERPDIRTLAFSLDGDRLATGARDGWIKIWQLPESWPARPTLDNTSAGTNLRVCRSSRRVVPVWPVTDGGREDVWAPEEACASAD